MAWTLGSYKTRKAPKRAESEDFDPKRDRPAPAPAAPPPAEPETSALDFFKRWINSQYEGTPLYDPALSGTGELVRDPSLRDVLSRAISGTGETLGLSERTAQEVASKATLPIEMFTPAGTATSADAAKAAAARGDYAEAALEGVGAVPLAGKAAALGAKALAPSAKAMILGLASRWFKTGAGKQALETAQRMAAEGASRDDILQATGLFQQHGDWKYEITDDEAIIGNRASRELGEVGKSDPLLPGALWHQELYDAHPELRGTRTRLRMSPEASVTGYHIAPGVLPGNEGRISAEAPDEDTLRRVLLHEVQHGVQHLENFPRGGSPADQSLVEPMRALKERAKGLFEQLDDERASWVRQQLGLAEGETLAGASAMRFKELSDEWKRVNSDKAKLLDRYFDVAYGPGGPSAGYRLLAGEVEARNVASRGRLSPSERRTLPPWQTQDVPDELQIVRHQVGENDVAQLAPEKLAPLPGAPSHIEGPVSEVVAAAEEYATGRGLDLKRQSRYATADPRRGRYIANAYERMRHDPGDPRVAASYQSLADETMAQWQALQDAGIKIDFMQPGQPDPYPGGPRDALADLRANKHLYVFPTEQGFGTINEITDNPLLASTGIVHGGHPMVVNDAFRAVHDVFGHGMEGANFGARGEENAWRAHRRLFSPEAVPALTSETRGQNSWVNFGPYGEANRANQRDTVFADQKTGLLPRWTYREGGMPLGYRLQQAALPPALATALLLSGSTRDEER